ncbi:hypothetical protein SPI_08352 [Niveomyces insectorum RCEF 264]|uniref:Copper acquisition factor BIM1-like domain-containing protein n=1 Tax=Niveomyces insectorum RCEF 264 TaxID=1081102 RepID=A0A167N8H7_9HYPO|nr:hypothetical protein SPI_08352 [Niveomyces insectorum RCEF 264]
MLSSSFSILTLASLASAHFQIQYPSWRADSLSNSNYSQYVFPCAGVPAGAWSDNRTDWPASGGSLSLDLHHPWTYVFVNIGLGENVTDFNYTVTPSFWNETGKGTLCVPHLDLPADLTPADGQHATIQVVTVGPSGEALYNCADITFRTSGVTDFGGQTCNGTDGVSYTIVNEEVNGKTSDNGTSSTDASPSGSSSAPSPSATKNAGNASSANLTVLTSVVALAVAFMYGMSA